MMNSQSKDDDDDRKLPQPQPPAPSSTNESNTNDNSSSEPPVKTKESHLSYWSNKEKEQEKKAKEEKEDTVLGKQGQPLPPGGRSGAKQEKDMVSSKKSLPPDGGKQEEGGDPQDDNISGVQPLPGCGGGVGHHNTNSSSLPGAYARTGRPTGASAAYHRETTRTTDHQQDADIETGATTAPARGTHTNGSDGSSGHGEVDDDVPIANPINVEEDKDTMQNAQEVQQSRDGTASHHHQEENKRSRLLFGILLVVAVIVAVAVTIPILLLASSDDGEEMDTTTTSGASGSSSSPTTSSNTTPHEDIGSYILSLFPIETVNEIKSGNTPQAKAFEWLIRDYDQDGGGSLSPAVFYPDWRIKQRYALVVLWFATDGPHWSLGGSGSWLNHSTHECSWEFSSLPDRLAPLPPEVVATKAVHFNPIWWSNAQKEVCDNYNYNNDSESNATTTTVDSNINSSSGNAYLRQLRLMRNNMEGTVPEEVYLFLPHLKALVLFGNKITGTISTNIGQLKELQSLDFVSNQVTGSIPSELGLLSDNLVTIGIHTNRLSGSLPTELGNLHQLQVLVAEENNISGAIPSELGRLSNHIYDLDLKANKISGSIPSQLGRLFAVRQLDLSENNLVGSVPPQMGLLTTNLLLSTPVPEDMAGNANLELFNISANPSLSGTIPTVTTGGTGGGNITLAFCNAVSFHWDCTGILCGCIGHRDHACPCAPEASTPSDTVNSNKTI